MNIGNLLRSIVRTVKANPTLAVVAVGLVAPKLATKVAPIVTALTTDADA